MDPVLTEEQKEEIKGAAEEQAIKEAGNNKPVTQEAIDRIYKEMRQTKEQLDRSEETNAQMVARLAEMEARGVRPTVTAPDEDDDRPLGEKYTPENFPKTKDEWDDLIAEEPMYGVDLRAQFLARQANERNSFEAKQTASRSKVETKHPDMFKRDDSGNFIRDAEGKIQIDQTSAKAKVFVDIVNRDLSIMNSVTWPELAMEAMENRLSGAKEEDVVKKLEEEKAAAEAKRQEEVKAGAVAGGGGAPPAEKPKVEVKFNSDEERKHAEGLVEGGKIKSLEDYCAVRDNNAIGYGRGGF